MFPRMRCSWTTAWRAAAPSSRRSSRAPMATSTSAEWPIPQPLPGSADGVEVSEAACAVLARAAGRVSTGLAAAVVTRRQACYRPVTDDGLPLIGRVLKLPGAYVATGHGPWGMLNAPATGLALAELIGNGRSTSVDLRPFDPARLPAARV